MIVGTLTIQPAPDRRAEILEVLRAIQGPVRAQIIVNNAVIQYKWVHVLDQAVEDYEGQFRS